jgi:translation initiation factor 4G
MIVVIYDTGMMLRLFMDIYDMQVVDEEVFLKWKEEMNDEYPGIGKALFQVIYFIVQLNYLNFCNIVNIRCK